MSFTCSRCGTMHDVPMSCAFEAPLYWYDLPQDEPQHRAVLDEELRTLDNLSSYSTARLGVPRHERPEPFEWVVWVSPTAASFHQVVATWEQSGRKVELRCFGWLGRRPSQTSGC